MSEILKIEALQTEVSELKSLLQQILGKMTPATAAPKNSVKNKMPSKSEHMARVASAYAHTIRNEALKTKFTEILINRGLWREQDFRA